MSVGIETIETASDDLRLVLSFHAYRVALGRATQERFVRSYSRMHWDLLPRDTRGRANLKMSPLGNV